LEISFFAKIHILEIVFFTKFTLWESHFRQYSLCENLIFREIHIMEISFLTIFTFWKSHFSRNSHYGNINLDNTHILKSNFPQNSQFWNLIYHKIHIMEISYLFRCNKDICHDKYMSKVAIGLGAGAGVAFTTIVSVLAYFKKLKPLLR